MSSAPLQVRYIVEQSWISLHATLPVPADALRAAAIAFADILYGPQRFARTVWRERIGEKQLIGTVASYRSI